VVIISSQFCQQSSGRTFFVTLNGLDTVGGVAGTTNTLCFPETKPDSPSAQSPGPCATIQNALQYARDGDSIQVDTGIYEICSTINVSKLVKITANNSRVILHSWDGSTVFHITTIGAALSTGGSGAPAGSTGVGASPSSSIPNFNQFAQIDGFAIGGATNPGAAAIFLDTDAYTAVTNNVLGGDPLTNPGQKCVNGQPAPNTAATGPIETFGNAESILLNSSDHPFIANNDILGSSIFQFSPQLAAGQSLTGFGVVTTECLGLGADSSDSVTLLNNLIARNTNAGVWLCSDGGGLHQIKSNVVRNNGRGVVLRAIDDTTIDANTITNDYQDGIVIYDASNNNTLTNNIIESNETPGAAGIRLGGFGAGLFPLATTLGTNTLLRNWVDVVITGARNTQLYGNTISADKDRTGILIQVGSQGAQGYTQPEGTYIGVSGQPPNKVISNGQCGSTAGCAIRLDQGVTTGVDATGTVGAAGTPVGPGPTLPPLTSSVSFNNFGLPPGADINTVLWHRPNDPSLGFINTGTNLFAAPPPTVGPTSAPTLTPATPTPVPTVAPNSTPTQ
jgi:parallel beta-helix repeat protein